MSLGYITAIKRVFSFAYEQYLTAVRNKPRDSWHNFAFYLQVNNAIPCPLLLNLIYCFILLKSI